MGLHGFICYARKDAADVGRLEVHLAPCSLRIGIDFWRDPGISAGSNWDATISARIAAARVFIVALTPDFFASEYIQRREWPAIVERSQSTDCLIVPVLLKRCRWAPFLEAHGGLQAVPQFGPSRN